MTTFIKVPLVTDEDHSTPTAWINVTEVAAVTPIPGREHCRVYMKGDEVPFHVALADIDFMSMLYATMYPSIKKVSHGSLAVPGSAGLNNAGVDALSAQVHVESRPLSREGGPQ